MCQAFIGKVSFNLNYSRRYGTAPARCHVLAGSYKTGNPQSFPNRKGYTMLDAGEDVKSLQMNLGHSSAAFTLNQYAHVSQKMRMQNSKRMNDYFSNLLPQAAPSV